MKILAENSFELEQVNWASHVVFVFNKYNTIQLHLSYQFNTVSEQKSYLIPRKDKPIDFFGEALEFCDVRYQ